MESSKIIFFKSWDKDKPTTRLSLLMRLHGFWRVSVATDFANVSSTQRERSVNPSRALKRDRNVALCQTVRGRVACLCGCEVKIETMVLSVLVKRLTHLTRFINNNINNSVAESLNVF